MNIQDFFIFQTVAKEGSLSRAARILYMSPQGLSKLIKNMENELDCILIGRSPQGVRLTESGECFLKHSFFLTDEYGDLKKDLLGIRQRSYGIVDLLSSYGILRLVTPDCIVAFQKAYPEIQFSYHEYPDLQTERLFLEKNGNVAFSIADFDETLYDITEMETFPICLLVHENHPLSHRASVCIDDLRGEPLYIESSQFKIHHLIVDKCRQAGFEPNIIFETSGFSLCHKMVKAGKGISVTVDFVFEDMKAQGLRLIPFSDGTYEWKICMLTRKGEAVSVAVSLFRNFVMDWMREIKLGHIAR